jgi:hypothetical protein
MSFWDQLTDGLDQMGSTIADWLPRLVVALLVLIIGRWVLKIVRSWAERLLATPAAQTVFDKAGVTGALAPSGKSPAAVVGTVLYAFLLVGLWLLVANILQVDAIVDLLERLLAFLPLVFVAGVIVLIAAAAASWIADLVRPYADQRQVPWLTTATRVIIVLFGVLAALDLLDITFAADLVKIVTAALGVTFAIAFGIGGIDTAKKWWGRYLAPRE